MSEHDRVPVAAGQKWIHIPSGDERIVYAVCTYRERAACDPTERERMMGVTHIAVMTSNPNDRRDSSDMELIGTSMMPAFPSTWRRVWKL